MTREKNQGCMEQRTSDLAVNLNRKVNETKLIIAELTLKSIESKTIETSGRSLDSSTNGTEEYDMEKWKKVVKETLAQGKVGNLNVDPEFLVFEPQSCEYGNMFKKHIPIYDG